MCSPEYNWLGGTAAMYEDKILMVFGTGGPKISVATIDNSLGDN